MYYDVFGDLREWGRVLDQLEELRAGGALDKHQPGLARLARYPFNWRIRQAGLRAIIDLKLPGDEVIRIANQIMSDEDSDLETRILAGRAVSACLSNGNGAITEGARSEAVARIQGLLDRPQAPALQRLAREWQHSLNSAARATTNTQ